MEQTAYHEQPLAAAAETEILLHDEPSHAHGADEPDYDPREYMATPIAWTAFFIGASALAFAGIIGGLLALWFYNYTTNGFS